MDYVRGTYRCERNAHAGYNSTFLEDYDGFESEYQDSLDCDTYKSALYCPGLKRREGKPRLFGSCVKSAIESMAMDGLITFERAAWVIRSGGLTDA